MRSSTREAIFGTIGVAILGVVAWILVSQTRSGGLEAQPTATPAAEEHDAGRLPTRIFLESPTPALGAEEAQPTPSPSPTATPSPLPQEHVVQPGETLLSIAAQYGLAPEAIAAKNDIVDPNMILAGQRLKLPAPDESLPSLPKGKQDERTYIVQEGDTLFAISQEFGISVEALAEANDIQDPTTLYVGRLLTIPEQAVPTP